MGEWLPSQLPALPQLPAQVIALLWALSITLGVVHCFFGYKVFKLVLAFWGFLAGGAAAALCAEAFWQNTPITILVGLGGAVLGAVLAVVLYFVAIFFLGAGMGFLLGGAIIRRFLEGPQPVVLVAVAVVCGVIALLMLKFIVILTTAFGGAYGIVGGVLHFLVREAPPEVVLLDGWRAIIQHAQGISPVAETMPAQDFSRIGIAAVAACLVLGLVGLVVQYATTRKKAVQEERHTAADKEEKSS